MKVTHYKPGDRVKLLKDVDGYGIKKGDIGTVTEPVIPKELIPYGSVMVRFDGDGSGLFGKIRFTNTLCIRECDLVPADSGEKQSYVRHIVFDITNDGGEAKYIDGKKVVRKAKVKRSYDDEPNDFNAMMFLIGKLFPESEMAVKKVERTDNVEEDYPDIEGFIRVRDAHENWVYIDVLQIDSVSVSKATGSVTVSTQGFSYELGSGYTIMEIMKKITNERNQW